VTWRGQSAAWAEVIPKSNSMPVSAPRRQKEKKFTSSHPDSKGNKCVSFSTLRQQDASQSGAQ
jgi:hypothetical protein